MKRILLGLGSALLIPVGINAQESSPAARLGRPGEPTIRAQAPDVQPAAGFEIPKTMPKGAVTETPSKSTPVLPAPGFAAGPTPVVPPGATIVGPVINEPYTPSIGAPIPSGPAMPFEPSYPMMGDTYGSDLSPWYVNAEILVAWLKAYRTPALATTGPTGSGANLAVPGVNVVIGNNEIGDNPRYGGRLTLGYWLNPTWAVEGSIFYIRSNDDTLAVNSGQFTGDLARPFFDINNGVESSEIVGRPGVVGGGVNIVSRSELFGGEINARKKWWSDCANRLDLIGGLRYIYLSDELNINEHALGLAGAGPLAGVGFNVQDTFKTTNQFYGVQVGAIFQHIYGSWSFELRGKVAVGFTRQEVNISGSSVPFSGGISADKPGGLLALNSNMGSSQRTVFDFVPEIGLNIGYDVTSRMRVFVGYSLLYWPNVVRPGGQIDRQLDINQIPNFTAGPPAKTLHPIKTDDEQSIWLQTVNFGISFRW